MRRRRGWSATPARASWSPAWRSSDSAIGRRRCGRSATRFYWRKLEIDSKHRSGGADPVRAVGVPPRPAEEARRRSRAGQAHEGTGLPKGRRAVREEEVPEGAHVLLVRLRELPERSAREVLEDVDRKSTRLNSSH